MKYYLIAGEPSGDLHGANLIEGLRKADPEAEFRFWGGDRMAEAGGRQNLRKHYRETSFFGIVQVLKNLRTIRRQMRECREDVAAWRPDALILIDYPGFNMKMARWASEHGIRTFYYIAPKVWAWREWRVKSIQRYVDRLYIIFPFERDYFPRHGIDPVFEATRSSMPSRHGVRRCPTAMHSAAATGSTTVRSLPWWPAAAAARSATTSRSWPGWPSGSPTGSSS